MFVSEIKNNYSQNINFASKYSSVIKSVRSQDAVVQLSGDVPSQVVSLVDTVNRLFGSLRKLEVQKSNPQAQNCLEILKKQHGFRGIMETQADGIILAENDAKNLVISSHGVNSLRLREQNVHTGEIESSIFIHDKKVVKNDTKHEIPKNLEYFKQTDIGYQFGNQLKTRLDDADFALLRVRRALSNPEFQAEINKVEPAKTIILKPTSKTFAKAVTESATEEKPIRRMSMTPDRVALINARLKDFSAPQPTAVAVKPVVTNLPKTEPKPTGVQTTQKVTEPEVKIKKTRGSSKSILAADEMQLVGEVKTLFNKAYSVLDKKNLSVNTRSLIKNGYDKIDKGLAGSRRLTFVGIGPDGANAGVNFATFQGYEFMQIRLTDKAGKVQDFIVNQQGKVTRTAVAFKDKLALGMVKGKENAYTREEVDKIGFVPLMQRLKAELEGYNQYLEARLSKTSEWKQRQTNPEIIGSLADEEGVINSLYEGFNKYKSDFRQVRFQKRAQLLSEIGFETKRGNPSILMRRVGEKEENIHLSFPMFLGKRATKIQLLGENDNVKQVFYILDNKLVRLNSDDIHGALRDDRKLRYYSEEDIERFGVKKYLSVINEHLQSANATVEKYKSKARGAKVEATKPAPKDKPAKVQSELRVQNNNDIILQLQSQIEQVRTDINKKLDELQKKLAQLLKK